MKYIYIFAAILLGIMSIVILNHRTLTQYNNRDSIDSYGTNVTLREYDENGRLKSILYAVSIKHYEKSGKTVAEKPDLTTHEDNNIVWHITANEGTLNKTGDQLILSGNVILHQLPTKESPETLVKTILLIINPKTSIATTQAFVTLKRGDDTVSGTGLVANLKTGDYTLQSGSHAVINPKNKK